MLLIRSSSTPAIRSLLSENPNTGIHTTKPSNHRTTATLSAVHGGRRPSLSSFSSHSSPISPSGSGFSEFNRKTESLSRKPLRRALSEGNLEGLASNSCDSNALFRSLSKHKNSMLHSAPSFSIYTKEDGLDGENETKIEEKMSEKLERSVSIGERIEEMGSEEFSFGKKGMGFIEENDEEEGEEEKVLGEFRDLGIEEQVEPASPPMYLATGFGVDGDSVGGGGGGGGGFAPTCFGEGGSVEEYFQRMLGENPSNPLFLRNYAQILQAKGDLHGAEEYFFRATLADPKDGEICSSYAKLVWDLHHDQDRALSYFEQAAQAAPEDSHVLAAYACFLWEIDKDEEEVCTPNHHTQSEEDKGLVEVQKTAFELEKGENIEDYYKRMIEENPCDPLFLGNYAQFLSQSKGDLQRAEEYYSRAILADPADGEIISQYASLVWELHRDHDKALSYFERAVQATPEDSHVLAAYARFLWETPEDEEEDSEGQTNVQAPLFVGAMTSANA